MSTPRATQMGMRFSDDTKLSRAAAIKCFQIPSRRIRWPAASTAAPVRSRRAAELPWQSKTVRSEQCNHHAGPAARGPSLFRGDAQRAPSRRPPPSPAPQPARLVLSAAVRFRAAFPGQRLSVARPAGLNSRRRRSGRRAPSPGPLPAVFAAALASPSAAHRLFRRRAHPRAPLRGSSRRFLAALPGSSARYIQQPISWQTAVILPVTCTVLPT